MSCGLRASAQFGTWHDMLPSRWISNGLSQIMATRPGAWDDSFAAGVQMVRNAGRPQRCGIE